MLNSRILADDLSRSWAHLSKTAERHCRKDSAKDRLVAFIPVEMVANF
jgi:hypothetical protein